MEDLLRKTDCYPTPLRAGKTAPGTYDLYPSFPVRQGVHAGFGQLLQDILRRKTVIIDGYEGVFWDRLVGTIESELRKRGRSVHLVDMRSVRKSREEIEPLIEPFMGEKDSIFGRMTSLRLIDYFDRDRLARLAPDKECDIHILYGTGAALSSWNGLLLYADLPKNELQFRMAAGSAFNLGTEERLDSREAYKRCYFIDWPVLDSHKGGLIDRIDWIIDAQRLDGYTCMEGGAFREALEEMCRNSFRLKPWFAPGVWGGRYLRDHIEGLNRKSPNIAWSYEIMALENGILFDGDGVLVETSFSFLMSYGYRKILGHCAEDFKEDFPIRFDFLDTLGGGNLSIQCHPRPEYIRSRFGKHYTQDETYYILRSENDSKVYLGFQEGVKKEEFKAALEHSESTAEKLDVSRYVQSFPSHKHDLFLIPNGTIHASGAGNLVLEISSAPYIFTFKMYDWVRPDIDGRPRPINIGHGLQNVRFERSGGVVSETLICRPCILEKTEGYVLEHLPTHKDHFYDIRRYTIHDGCRVEIPTENKFHVWMIVEGSDVEVEVTGGRTAHYNYMESFILPAAAESYALRNASGRDVVLVQAFVKDHYLL